MGAVMEGRLMSTEDALTAHRVFLQEILAEVMPILSEGTASDERLMRALDVYWEACFARREIRCAVLAATRNSEFEKAVEPMGKPFLMMVRGELLPRHGARADQLALTVYDAARQIAVDEAAGGQRVTERRRVLIALIRSAA